SSSTARHDSGMSPSPSPACPRFVADCCTAACLATGRLAACLVAACLVAADLVLRAGAAVPSSSASPPFAGVTPGSSRFSQSDASAHDPHLGARAIHV